MEGEIYRSTDDDLHYRHSDRGKVEISSFENVIRAPEKFVERLIDAIEKAKRGKCRPPRDDTEKGTECPCTGIDDKDYPTLSLHLRDKNEESMFVDLGPKDYLKPGAKSRKRCRLAIVGNGRGGDWYLGLPFVKAYYSIYDFDKNRIGLIKVADKTRERHTYDALFRDKVSDHHDELDQDRDDDIDEIEAPD